MTKGISYLKTEPHLLVHYYPSYHYQPKYPARDVIDKIRPPKKDSIEDEQEKNQYFDKRALAISDYLPLATKFYISTRALNITKIFFVNIYYFMENNLQRIHQHY